MTYTILPNSGQSLGVTRIPINTNFSLIQSVFDKNHIDFNAPGPGKHKFLQMPVQSAAPSTLSSEGAFYSKTSKGDAQAFWRFENSGIELQMTNNTINAVASPGAVPMMNGMTMQWGNAIVTSGTPIAFFATFTSVVSIQVSIVDAGPAKRLVAYINSFTQSGFIPICLDSSGNPTTLNLYYIAIGFL
jgi:hypothetical protein